MLLTNFHYTRTLNTNLPEKTIILLGTIQGQEGDAILIITTKTPLPTCLKTLDSIIEIFHNDIYSRYETTLTAEYDIQTIFPATAKHLTKYQTKHHKRSLESYSQYTLTCESLLNKELKHIDWVTNIIEGKSEQERILFVNNHFTIIPDLKFSNMAEISTMHLLIIFHNPLLHSLRDLTKEHLPLLQECKLTLNKVLEQVFIVSLDDVRMFLHYPPTFYRLHIHVMSLEMEGRGCVVERAHDLDMVMQNLDIREDYYQFVQLSKCALEGGEVEK